jgi:16S rRNA C967 or C1407 C5-methylase (RsmB/RsmF family)/NOL1/NOP2/fmu family ribosome biogenesis protein
MKMNFPPDFVARTRSWLGDAYPFLEQALEAEAPVSIRVNRAKGAARPALACEPVEWCDTGFYLPHRPAFTFDPCLHAGMYYVQEASSMFLEQAVKQYITSPVVCLDVCAAPGGKSTHLLSLLPEKSLLVCNEVVRNRCAVLVENICKWGSAHAVVTHNQAAEIGRLTHLFDVIVADLPCSGEGMFRKDVGSRAEWSTAHVLRCAIRQREIVADVWAALKPGGLLVYSTCTFNREENEDNVHHIVDTLGAEVLPIQGFGAAPNPYGFPAYRFFPHEVKGEGFFLAVLRKGDGPRKTMVPAHKAPRTTSAACAPVDAWLTNPGAYVYHFVPPSAVWAIPCEHGELYRLLSERLRIVSAGIPAGGRRGHETVPTTALALSSAFRREAFASYDLTWEQAVGYLQREALRLPDEVPKGFVTVTYRHTPLGFVKHMGLRANNVYPQEWRIRSKYRPADGEVTIVDGG